MSTLRSLTFHIGMPKTATTALQAHVFPAFPGYVGKNYGRAELGQHSEHDFTVQACRRALGSPRWREELAAWIKGLRESPLSDVMFSDETLCAWPDGKLVAMWPMLDAWRLGVRTRPHPIVKFLAETLKLVDEGTQVRVILTLRNQSDFMGSLYAQIQPRLLSPSQADFDGKVTELLESGDPFFDFAGLVAELDAVLGPDNCLILLHEDGVAQNVRRIIDFLGLPSSLRPPSVPETNVKASGERAWQYRVTLPLLKRGLIGRVRKAVEIRVVKLGGQQPRIRMFLARLDNLSQSIVPLRDVKGVQIVVSESLAAQIRVHFASSNARLTERLDRDLLSLGY